MADIPDSVTTEIDLLQNDEEFTTLLGAFDEAAKRKLFEILTTRMSTLVAEPKDEVNAVKAEGGEEIDVKPAENDTENVLTAPVGHIQTPKIGTFSGDEPMGKGDISYDQWRHEVSCLMKDGFREKLVLLAMRRSLKGTAASVMLNLGVDIHAKDVLEKFNVVFGNILPNEMLLEDFYTARQLQSETVVAWGCRIERLLMKAKEQGTIQGTEDMARTKFWSGIKDERVKTALRHKFDSGSSFHELLRNARLLEHEFQSKVKVSSQLTPDWSGIESRLAKLEETLNSFMSNKSGSGSNGSSSTGSAPVCNYCKKKGHKIGDCRILKSKNAKKSQQENSQQPAPGTGS
jgi:hypothetical protein